MLEILQSSSSAAPSQKPTDTLVENTAQKAVGSLGDVFSCEAIEGKNPNMTQLLGTNKEVLLLSYNQDSTYYSLLGGEEFQFPQNIIISGRNVSINRFTDGSMRLEVVDEINKNLSLQDGFGGNGTRLERSKIDLILEGREYMDPVIILDGKGGVQVILKSE